MPYISSDDVLAILAHLREYRNDLRLCKENRPGDGDLTEKLASVNGLLERLGANITERVIALTISKDCDACPSAWSGLLTDGRHWRARYRWGVLRFTVDRDPNKMSVFSREDAEVLQTYRLGGEYDGAISFEEVRQTLINDIDFSRVI